MRRPLTLTLFCLIAITCSHQSRSSPWSVTYVSNCGFLIETGGRKIIFDGLLASGESKYYYLPSDSNGNLMRTAAAPFDNIDLILVTHAHHDHFDAAVTASNMLHNPKAQLIGMPQVDEQLRTTDEYDMIKDRLHIVPAPTDTIARLNIDGIQIDALPSKHSAYWDEDTLTGEKINLHANMQHLEYIVRIDSRVMYHSGDADLNDILRYQSFGFGDTTIDLAMVDWWDERPSITFDQKLIRDIIRPKRIFMMHMFPSRPPRGNPCSQTLVAPHVYLADSLMQTWVFESK